MIRKFLALGLAAMMLNPAMIVGASPFPDKDKDRDRKNNSFGDTSTPIKHVVVIFGENISFDHYFGTYPNAENPSGEPRFEARKDTPTVNGIAPTVADLENNALGSNNPNFFNVTGNGVNATNPFRLDRTQALTSSQSHAYTNEQAALHQGLVDLYPISTGAKGAPPNAPPAVVLTKGLNMGYFDGNTVTAMWNYAQHFAMNDNSFDTNYGPSTVGLINLVSGQTNGIAVNFPSTSTSAEVADGNGGFSLIGDRDPFNDVCSSKTSTIQMSSRNIGDMLTSDGVTWGSFMGGFDLTKINANGSTGCTRSSVNPQILAFQLANGATMAAATASATINDYVPHHAFLQYYSSTLNPSHTRPASISEIGKNGPANHEYDIHDFFDAVNAGNFPAVNFLKAPAFQDGHPGNSDPLDEQTFVTTVINFLEHTKDWKETAVILMYDDSDGWYDHVMPPIVNQSSSTADVLTTNVTTVNGLTTATLSCGNGATALPGVDNGGNAHAQGRCGYGPRQPLLVISPYSRENFVDHTITDQTSVLRFIEDNWLGGERVGKGSFDNIANSIVAMFNFDNCREDDAQKLFLDPATGLRTNH
jgi:phospholipase C